MSRLRILGPRHRAALQLHGFTVATTRAETVRAPDGTMIARYHSREVGLIFTPEYARQRGWSVGQHAGCTSDKLVELIIGGT